jgi:hypothetical protein
MLLKEKEVGNIAWPHVFERDVEIVDVLCSI